MRLRDTPFFLRRRPGCGNIHSLKNKSEPRRQMPAVSFCLRVLRRNSAVPLQGFDLLLLQGADAPGGQGGLRRTLVRHTEDHVGPVHIVPT